MVTYPSICAINNDFVTAVLLDLDLDVRFLDDIRRVDTPAQTSVQTELTHPFQPRLKLRKKFRYRRVTTGPQSVDNLLFHKINVTRSLFESKRGYPQFVVNVPSVPVSWRIWSLFVF